LIGQAHATALLSDGLDRLQLNQSGSGRQLATQVTILSAGIGRAMP